MMATSLSSASRTMLERSSFPLRRLGMFPRTSAPGARNTGKGRESRSAPCTTSVISTGAFDVLRSMQRVGVVQVSSSVGRSRLSAMRLVSLALSSAAFAARSACSLAVTASARARLETLACSQENAAPATPIAVAPASIHAAQLMGSGYACHSSRGGELE